MKVRLYEPESAFLAILLNVAFVVGVCLLGLLIVQELNSADPPEPNYAEIKDFGCKVFQDERFNRRWQVLVWAEYREGKKEPTTAKRWQTLFAIRDNRKAALADCNDWMDKVDKKLKHLGDK